jgi:hypothetical protein
VAITTKSFLVTRDIDVLGQLAEHRAAGVSLTLTTLDQSLAKGHYDSTCDPRPHRPRTAPYRRGCR